MTEDMAASITWYHTLFIVCLILFLICLGIAAVLFFVLHIADAVNYLTGRGERRQILQWQRDASAGSRTQVKEDKKAKYTTKRESDFSGGSTEELFTGQEVSVGIFEIEREWLLVHTDEMI